MTSRESYHGRAAEADPAAIEAAFAALEAGGRSSVSTHEGVAPKDIVLQRTIDMMYQGQWRSLAVPAPRRSARSRALVEASTTSTSANTISAATSAPVGLFRLNLKAVGVVPKAELAEHEPTGAPAEPRSAAPQVWFDGHGGARNARLLARPICRPASPSRARHRRAARFHHRRAARRHAPRSTVVSTSSFVVEG